MSLTQPDGSDGVFAPTNVLFCALALEPRSFSRNKYFDKYRDPERRRCHGRARWLRRLAADVCQAIEQEDWEVTLSGARHWTLVTYEGKPLSVRRTVQLTQVELGILDVLLLDLCADLPPALFALTDELRVALVPLLNSAIAYGKRLDDDVCVSRLFARLQQIMTTANLTQES